MKNLKKLSLALMLATLFSTSFTSCIDNNVSPLVEAIYGAQADLIAAQAAVQNAEAALLNAQAQTEAAMQNLLAAQAAQISAATAADTSRWAEELATLIEMNDIAVADAQQDLANAQTAFEAEMEKLAQQLAAANAELAQDLTWQYAGVMYRIGQLTDDKMTAMGNKATKEALLALGEYAPNLYMADLYTSSNYPATKQF